MQTSHLPRYQYMKAGVMLFIEGDPTQTNPSYQRACNPLFSNYVNGVWSPDDTLLTYMVSHA